jgi:hypothetical protein
MNYAKKADVQLEVSEELKSDFIYNPKTGRLENINEHERNNHNNTKNPSCVEFLSHTEKFSLKKEISNQ